MPRNDGDRDRPSWRDIDRKRDGSAHVDKKDPYKKAQKGVTGDGRSKSYRSALDSFFDGGALPERYQKLSSQREKLSQEPGSRRQQVLKQLREAVGRSEVAAAVQELLAIDGALPRDPEALLAVLQHPDEEQVRQAIALLAELILERPFKRKDLLAQRLRQVEDLAEEPETSRLAGELRRKL